MIPWLNVTTSDTTASVGKRRLSTPSSLRPASKAGFTTDIQRRCTSWRRSRTDGTFQPMACISSHTLW